MSFTFYNPTKVIFGVGSIASLEAAKNDFDAARVLLVTGSKSLKTNGTYGRLLTMLKPASVTAFEGVPANPELDVVEGALELARSHKCTLVVGVGGGSVLDVAKIVSLFAPQDGHSVESLLKAHGQWTTNCTKLPFIAAPTTSGTGSEVTRWATVWGEGGKKKLSVEHERMYPDLAIVDPELVLGLSPAQTASTGLDALCQATEAFWSKNAQPVSDALALAAIENIAPHLALAHAEPDNIKYRGSMARGSLLAGMAFSNTKTTACHSVSYPLTSYFNVPHGHAVAITMPSILKFNEEALPEKLKKLCPLFGVKTVTDVAEKITALMQKMGLATRLSSLGVTKENLHLILDNGFTPDRMKHNPREMTRVDLEKILLEIL